MIVMLPLSLILQDPHAAHEGEGFFTQYYELLTNPAHIAFELTLMLIVDVLLVGLLWPLIRKLIDAKLRKQHAAFDREHGIHHHGDHIHLDPSIVHPHTEHPDHD
jgi:hypothetical protein